VETRISILGWDCYVGGDDVLRNQRRSPMLKKILATGLFGSILLSLPLQAQATVIQYGTSKASGAMVAQNTLSASDKQAIRQLLQKMMQATNDGDAKAVLTGFSPNYQDDTNGGRNSYRSMKSGVRMMVAFLKSYGVILTAKDVRINGVGKNQALVSVEYKVDISPEMLEEMTTEERASYESSKMKNQGTMLFTLEKTNGRWLVVSMRNPAKDGAAGLPIGGGNLTVSNSNAPAQSANASAKDRQAVKSLFAQHLQSLNREDLKGYLATLDSGSAKYDQVKAQTIQLFKDYNLKYELKSLEIVSLNGNTGVVKMVATVKRVSGASFTDSKIVTFNTIKKSKGKWQIADTEVESPW
jgi:hypothetical protein